MISTWIWAGLVIVSGALAVWGKAPTRLWVHWIAKPVTILVIIAATITTGSLQPSSARPWFVAALVCSLAGDVFLMFKQRFFTAGLVAFLLAHVSYMVSFSFEVPWQVAQLAFLLPPLVVGLLVTRGLWPFLGGMKAPVVVYVIALVLVAWRLMARQAVVDSVGLASVLWGGAGAALFVFADSVLARHHFARRPVPYTLELGAYFAAQWCIAASTWR